MTIIYLFCEDDHISASIGGRVDAKLHDEAEVDYYFARNSNAEFFCSSSLDFPDEFTENQSIRDLCDYIRK